MIKFIEGKLYILGNSTHDSHQAVGAPVYVGRKEDPSIFDHKLRQFRVGHSAGCDEKSVDASYGLVILIHDNLVTKKLSNYL